MSNESVDWDYWRQIPKVAIWQAVLLTLNSEPNEYRFDKNNFLIKGLPWEDSPPHNLPDFSRRLDIACKNLGTKLVAEYKKNELTEDKDVEVLVDEFVSWAISSGWDMPPECISLHVKPISLDSTGVESPNFHGNTSDKLRYLCLASRKFWFLADPLDKSTYPDTNEIIDWLMKRGYSAGSAKSGASIIRPKWAGSGRR
jgi:hypothetical protein